MGGVLDVIAKPALFAGRGNLPSTLRAQTALDDNALTNLGRFPSLLSQPCKASQLSAHSTYSMGL